MAERTCNLNMRTLTLRQDIFVYGSIKVGWLKAPGCIIFLKIIHGVKQQLAWLISWCSGQKPDHVEKPV